MLPDLVKEYNNTGHSSIKMTPVNASKKTKLQFGEIFTRSCRDKRYKAQVFCWGLSKDK